jgi:hypothetical protein
MLFLFNVLLTLAALKGCTTPAGSPEGLHYACWQP